MGSGKKGTKAVRARKEEMGKDFCGGRGRTHGTPTAETIAIKLRLLASAMDDVAVDLDYYGGFAKWSEHGREMSNAGNITRQWADEIFSHETARIKRNMQWLEEKKSESTKG